MRPAPPPPPEHRRLFTLEPPVRILEMRVTVFAGMGGKDPFCGRHGRGTRQARRESHILFARFPRAERTVAIGASMLAQRTLPRPSFLSQGSGTLRGASETGVSAGVRHPSLLVQSGTEQDVALTSFPARPVKLYSKILSNKLNIYNNIYSDTFITIIIIYRVFIKCWTLDSLV